LAGRPRCQRRRRGPGFPWSAVVPRAGELASARPARLNKKLRDHRLRKSVLAL